MKRLVLFLFLGLTRVQADIILELKDLTAVTVSDPFIEENKTLKHIITDLGLENNPEEIIPVLNDHVTKETIKQLQLFTGKDGKTVQALSESLSQEILAPTLLAADFLEYQHTDTLMNVLSQKLLTEGISPQVTDLFETIKIINGQQVVKEIHNGTMRNSLIDQITKDIKNKFCKNSIHTKELVKKVMLSPDGKYYVVIFINNNNPELYDIFTGKLVIKLEGHKSWITEIDFSFDSRYITTCSNDTTVKLWDVTNGECLKTFAEKNKDNAKPVTSAQVSPDNTKIIAGYKNGTIKLWDIPTGECIQTLETNKSEINSVKFSPDGTRLITISSDSTIRLWDTDNYHLVNTFNEHEGPNNNSIEFSPDGKYILTAAKNAAKLYDALTGILVRTFQEHENLITSVDFSPDNKHVATGSNDYTAKLWDIETNRCLKTFRGHGDFLISTQFSRDGTKIVTGAEENAAKVWDIATGECMQTLKTNRSVTVAQFSSTGNHIITLSNSNIAELWSYFIPAFYESAPLTTLIKWVKTEEIDRAPDKQD